MDQRFYRYPHVATTHPSKAAKGAKAAKKGQKDDTYLDEDEDDMEISEDMKAESKGAGGGGRSAKVAKEVVWSKEEDYF